MRKAMLVVALATAFAIGAVGAALANLDFGLQEQQLLVASWGWPFVRSNGVMDAARGWCLKTNVWRPLASHADRMGTNDRFAAVRVPIS
jgi:hypothetical protein